MKLHVNGLDLFYEKSGEGKPLILLHGNTETHRIFDRAIPLLAARYTVYAIDSRGHGESDKVERYHYDDMKEDVRCFIEQLQLTRPLLCGASDGAIIGLILASAYPALLSGLIACGANTKPSGIRDGWMKFFAFANSKVNDPRMDMMLTEPNITAEMLQRIAVPTLVLAGGHDMIKRADTEFIAASIKNSELRILPLQGHTSYISHRKRIAKLILAFADERLDG